MIMDRVIMNSIVDEFFEDIANESNIDVNKVLSWGFYFSDKNKETLREAKKILREEGYISHEIFYENKTYYLCIEEIKKHNKKSLHQICKKFNHFAKEYDIHSFDGFDVEEIGLK
eukprot:TRINITY_DN2997_c0_g1_i2.p1 TRINITY_DN2997_c0_g1~~TRINITY_DN2997_c0_g1_i2.p1  ORF type:complete len:115 (+),score=8.01 TRINITY_DN2997_c0_g1_i2:2-346(+)